MRKIIKFKYSLVVFSIELITLLLITLIIYNFLTNTKVHKSTFYLKVSNTKTLLETMKRNGYKIYPLDMFLLKYVALPKKGWYTIDSQITERFEFLKTLHNKRAPTMHVKIYAGETSEELIYRLANDMKLNPHILYKQYQKRSQYKEANIFSGTYTIARDADENATIDYLLDTSKELLDKFQTQIFHKKLSYIELKVLLIIASIIQKESNSPKEMPLISSVIYNRLNKNMRLQMDGTLNYGKYAHIIVTPERIKTDESNYNTYKHKGIPPHPLSTISLDALKAAYHPAQTDYLFFMLNKDGSHNFAATYKEHINNIHSFKSKTVDENKTKPKDSNNTYNLKSSA